MVGFVIVGVEHWSDRYMNGWLMEMLSSFGYFGIALLIAIENIFPPIPSEVILTFSGFLTTVSNLTPVGVVLSATLGALIGALVLYFVGTLFSLERILRFIESKWGRWLGFKKADLDKTMAWFLKRGKLGVLFGRCVPVIRSIVSIPAGVVKMPLVEFILYTTIGTLIWNTVLVFLGVQLGERWESVVAFFDTYTLVVLILLIFIAIYLVVLWIKRKQKQGE